jgi:hypothetical protein
MAPTRDSDHRRAGTPDSGLLSVEVAHPRRAQTFRLVLYKYDTARRLGVARSSRAERPLIYPHTGSLFPFAGIMNRDEKTDLKVAVPEVASGLPSPQSDVQGEEAFIVSEEERLLVRKLDRRILPIACLMYLFACQCSGYSTLR